MSTINYNGRESELGGIIDLVDGPVYHSLGVHLSRAKLIARSTIDSAAKFSKSRIQRKVLEGSALIFQGI